jgi:hypothetical protein
MVVLMLTELGIEIYATVLVFILVCSVENRPSAKMRGIPKSLHLENHAKSQ